VTLNYRARREGRNKRRWELPPKGSDARGFIDMAIAIGAFLLVGIVVAGVFEFVKSAGSHP